MKWAKLNNYVANMKAIHLTSKEIARASEDGITIVVRRQAACDEYMVAAVRVSTRRVIRKPSMVIRADVPKAVKMEVRMLSKCGMGDRMADSSRHR